MTNEDFNEVTFTVGLEGMKNADKFRMELEALRDVQQAAREYMLAVNEADEDESVGDFADALWAAVEHADSFL